MTNGKSEGTTFGSGCDSTGVVPRTPPGGGADAVAVALIEEGGNWKLKGVGEGGFENEEAAERTPS